MSSHHSDQMSQTQVSWVALWGCSLNVFVIVLVFVFVIVILLVRSPHMIRCFKDHKSLELLSNVFVFVFLLVRSCLLITLKNVSKVTRLWDCSLVTWIIVVISSQIFAVFPKPKIQLPKIKLITSPLLWNMFWHLGVISANQKSNLLQRPFSRIVLWISYRGKWPDVLYNMVVSYA